MSASGGGLSQRVMSIALRGFRQGRLDDVTRFLADRLPGRLRRRLKATLTRAETAVGRPTLLVPPEALEARYSTAIRGLLERHGAHALGDYLEFGVYVGTSLGCMDRALKGHGLAGTRLFGFDSFEGLPEAARTDDEGLWGEPGRWSSDYENTVNNLTRQGVDWSRTILVPGWYDETLTAELRRQHAMVHAGIIMIDCDLYSSAKVALDFCAPLIRREAVIFFDDWEDVEDRDLGEKRAFREFLDEHPDLVAQDLGGYGSTGKVFSVTTAGQ